MQQQRQQQQRRELAPGFLPSIFIFVVLKTPKKCWSNINGNELPKNAMATHQGGYYSDGTLGHKISITTLQKSNMAMGKSPSFLNRRYTSSNGCFFFHCHASGGYLIWFFRELTQKTTAPTVATPASSDMGCPNIAFMSWHVTVVRFSMNTLSFGSSWNHSCVKNSLNSLDFKRDVGFLRFFYGFSNVFLASSHTII